MADESSTKKSSKTPAFYLDVADILKDIDHKAVCVKQACYTKRRSKQSSVRFRAVICQVLKYEAILDRIISSTCLERAVQKYDLNLYLVKFLVFESVISKRSIFGSTKCIQLVKKYKQDLEDALMGTMNASGYDNLKDFLASTTPSAQITLPRYVRVNTLRTTTDEVIDSLTGDGLHRVDYSSETSYEEFISKVKQLKKYEFMIDIHIPNVLIFNSALSFSHHFLFKEGYVILQDKASCFAVHLLAPRPDSLVIDACAAPGMKTTHLVALMNNEGGVLAVDRDKKRAAVMDTIFQKCGVQCAEIHVGDFLLINPDVEPYSDVEYILLDPSCSCSGIVYERNLAHDDNQDLDNRLRRLSAIQLRLLRHALSFPKVVRVSYSTCSVYPEENEGVVMQALSEVKQNFCLVSPPAEFPVFHNSDVYKDLDGLCVKTVSERDLTNGFFLAVFQRRPQKEKARIKRSKNKSR